MSAWESIDRYLEGLGIRVGTPTLGQTTGGKHAPNSHHYDARARDYGRSSSDVRAITNALLPLARGDSAPIVELFDSTSGVFYKNGRPITPSASLRRGHYSHVHVAVAPGVDLATFGGNGTKPTAAPLGELSLVAMTDASSRRPRSGLGDRLRAGVLVAGAVGLGLALVVAGAARTAGGTT